MMHLREISLTEAAVRIAAGAKIYGLLDDPELQHFLEKYCHKAGLADCKCGRLIVGRLMTVDTK